MGMCPNFVIYHPDFDRVNGLLVEAVDRTAIQQLRGSKSLFIKLIYTQTLMKIAMAEPGILGVSFKLSHTAATSLQALLMAAGLGRRVSGRNHVSVWASEEMVRWLHCAQEKVVDKCPSHGSSLVYRLS